MRVRPAPLAAAGLAVIALALAALAETPAPKKAEEQFKNIQSLKGYPADDVVPAMEFMSAALGVDCAFCHVDNAPEKDDKEHKQIARQMIAMTLTINRDHFGGKQEVTCVSCHNGAAHPRTVPVVATVDAPHADEGTAPAPLPAAEAVLAKYVQAVGGAEALAKVTSRRQKGAMTGFGNPPLPIEVFGKAPDRRISVVHRERGDSSTAFDGTRGWLGGPGRPPRDMVGGENDSARLDAQLQFPAEVASWFKEVRTRRSEPIDGKPTVRVVGLNPGQPPVEMWFDAASGVLVRQVRSIQTPLGRNPTQVDYADYRDADGIKVPFRWTVSRPSGRFTIQIDEMTQNVPLEDDRFKKPEPSAP